MEDTKIVVNKLLSDTFNDMIGIEEMILKKGFFNDISVKEVHTIEAIGMYIPRSMSEVAAALSVTMGTLTVSINNLVEKGYVIRERQETDRRVVKVSLTKKGKLLFRIHQQFHLDLVKEFIHSLNEDESRGLTTSLIKLHEYLRIKYLEQEENK